MAEPSGSPGQFGTAKLQLARRSLAAEASIPVRGRRPIMAALALQSEYKVRETRIPVRGRRHDQDRRQLVVAGVCQRNTNSRKGTVAEPNGSPGQFASGKLQLARRKSCGRNTNPRKGTVAEPGGSPGQFGCAKLQLARRSLAAETRTPYLLDWLRLASSTGSEIQLHSPTNDDRLLWVNCWRSPS